jgi:hypothetical protein
VIAVATEAERQMSGATRPRRNTKRLTAGIAYLIALCAVVSRSKGRPRGDFNATRLSSGLPEPGQLLGSRNIQGVYGVYKTVVRGNGDGFAAYFEPQHDGRPYRRTIGNFTTLEFAQQGCQQDFNNIVAMHGEPRSYAASLNAAPTAGISGQPRQSLTASELRDRRPDGRKWPRWYP